MRTRLCYLALVLIPLLAYAPLLWQGYGTPEDFVRLAGEADASQDGILHGALVEIVFHAVHGVADFALVRGLAVALLILTAVALWQLLERGGWSAVDAAAVALVVVLLPSAQLYAGWGPAWPAVLAALLSIAGFAAAESELEPGGPKRAVGLLGGGLLYFGAAMCFMPNAIMALVPLAALTFARPLRFSDQLYKWFASHTALMVLGIFGAWILERWMMADAGLSDRTALAERLIALFSVAVPSSWAVFVVGEDTGMRIVCAVLALAVLAAVVMGARHQVREDGRVQVSWLLGLLGPFSLFALIVALSPHWQPSYRTLWPIAGVVAVALATSVRGIGDRTGRKPFWHYAAMAGLVVVGALAAATQSYTYLAEPLQTEWRTHRAAVMRATFAPEATAVLVVAPGAAQTATAQAHFSGSVQRQAVAARGMFNAALRERFPSGLPKGQKIGIEVRTEPPAETSAGVVVFDLTKAAR